MQIYKSQIDDIDENKMETKSIRLVKRASAFHRISIVGALRRERDKNSKQNVIKNAPSIFIIIHSAFYMLGACVCMSTMLDVIAFEKNENKNKNGRAYHTMLSLCLFSVFVRQIKMN